MPKPKIIDELHNQLHNISEQNLDSYVKGSHSSSLLRSALILYATLHPSVRDRVAQSPQLKRHVEAIKTLEQKDLTQEQRFKLFNRLPEGVKQFFIFQAFSDPDQSPQFLSFISEHPSIRKTLKKWAERDPAWLELTTTDESTSPKTTRTELHPHEISPRVLTSIPYHRQFHVILALRHQETQESALIYTVTEWDQNIKKLIIRRLPEMPVNARFNFFAPEANPSDLIAMSLYYFSKDIPSYFVNPNVSLDSMFLSADSWGPGYLLHHIFQNARPEELPFQARTWRPILLPALENCIEKLKKMIPQLPEIYQNITNNHPPSVNKLTRFTFPIHPTLFDLILSAVYFTQGKEVFLRLLMWLERNIPEKNQPGWFKAYLRLHHDQKIIVTASPGIEWHPQTRKAILHGLIWYLSLNSEKQSAFNLNQQMVRQHLSSFVFLRETDLLELLRGTGEEPSSPLIIP